MRRELSTLLKRVFHQRMKRSFPDYQKTATNLGGIVYRKRKESSGSFLFVFFFPSPKDDRFTIELAANNEPDFPFELMPGDKTKDGTARYRIRAFVDGNWDGWWELANTSGLDLGQIIAELRKTDEALQRIPIVVDEAVSVLHRAIPRFASEISASPRL